MAWEGVRGGDCPARLLRSEAGGSRSNLMSLHLWPSNGALVLQVQMKGGHRDNDVVLLELRVVTAHPKLDKSWLRDAVGAVCGGFDAGGAADRRIRCGRSRMQH